MAFPSFRVIFVSIQKRNDYAMQKVHNSMISTNPTSNQVLFLKPDFMKNINITFAALLLLFLLPNFGYGQFIGSFVYGNVFTDTDDDCEYFQGEPGLAGWIITATDTETDETFQTTTSQWGWYNLNLETPAEYEITVAPPNNDLIATSCVDSYLIELEENPNPQDSLGLQADFPISSVTSECPHYMFVDISSWSMRRCFDNIFYVSYCNYGLEDEEDAYVEVTLDPELTYVESSIPVASVDGNTYTFNLGAVPSGECGDFTVTANLNCEAEMGATHCVDAHIYPDEICTGDSAGWSGASLKVTGSCDGDEVQFIIENVGDAPMEAPSEFLVVEDHVIMMTAEVPVLAPGGTHLVTKDANGSTYRMEVDQVPDHPGNSQPSAWVEGCLDGPGEISFGFVTQFPEDDNDPYISIHCLENTASYDPNEKDAFPRGFSEQHYIEPGTDLEYVIHFQNTGTDTAFKVVLVDQLSDFLVKSSVRPGASSHEYEFFMTPTGEMRFVFDNIMLPDSNVNEPASHGFVKFRVSHRQWLQLGTEINNQVAIYFDFNEPVITNETWHILNEDFIEIVSSAVNPEYSGVKLSIGPNPFSDETNIQLEGLDAGQISMYLYDLQGRQVSSENYSGPSFRFQRGNLSKGVYLFRIEQEGRWVANGKMVIQ